MNSQDASPFFSRNPAPETDHPLSIRGRFGRLSFIGWYAFLNMISSFASIAFSLAAGIFHFSTMTLNNQFADLLTGMAGLCF